MQLIEEKKILTGVKWQKEKVTRPPSGVMKKRSASYLIHADLWLGLLQLQPPPQELQHGAATLIAPGTFQLRHPFPEYPVFTPAWEQIFHQSRSFIKPKHCLNYFLLHFCRIISFSLTQLLFFIQQ